MLSSPKIGPVLVTATRYRSGGTPDASTRCEVDELIENRHLGWAIVYDQQHGLLYSTPGADQTATFFRSAAKPFQAFPLIEEGYASALSVEELALTCASHTGSSRHCVTASTILQKANLTEAALQCGSQTPIDSLALDALRQSNQAPSPLHHNCSGKHAGMLFCCRSAGWDVGTYLQPEHPLQRKILSALQTWGTVRDIPVAVDGCGAPVFYLPLLAMARLYAQLGLADEFKPLRQAMLKYPELVGGEGRVDTVIMQASQGQILAKVGADGVLCASHVGKGQGVALKISDGSTWIRNITFVEMLVRLGWLDAYQARDRRLAPFRNLLRSNAQGAVIGRYHVHFDCDALI